MRVNGDRLWQSLMDLATIGATPKGGVCRLTLTDLDRQARDRVIGWLREAGCAVDIDGVGNIFAIRAGRTSSGPVVLSGSHIDTQPSGGKFDGNYGVLAGLEVLRTLNDHSVRTEKPVGVAVWTNEEGSRFVPVMGGSGAFAGVFPVEEILRQKDIDGISFDEALQRIGYNGATPVGGRALDAYFEAHIEQGPILEHEDKIIGIVTGALGLRWYDCIWSGQDAHAGPTPMEARHDALRGASRMVETVHQLALRFTAVHGWVHAGDELANVIPGHVNASVDLRHPDDSALAAMDAELRTTAAVSHQASRGLRVKQVAQFAACRFDAACIEHNRGGTNSVTAPGIVSGAGHDAIWPRHHPHR
jgi:N-carbamoyl-L-amino-acid hydrolase